MTYTEILELIRAGYTKKEIDAMVKAELKEPEPAAHEKDPEPVEDQKKEPAPAEEQKQEPAAAPQETETEKMVKALGLKFDALTSALQNMNINNIEGTNQLTAEDVIAKIINPHYNEGGKK